MAFSNLTSLTQQQYQALPLNFNTSPGKSQIGSPDPRVTINLGGWASETILGFTLTINAGASAGMIIDMVNSNTLDVSIVPGPSTQPTLLYYTVDVGSSDQRNTNWQINFQVQAQGVSTGTWVFVKGKIGDDSDQF